LIYLAVQDFLIICTVYISELIPFKARQLGSFLLLASIYIISLPILIANPLS